jgi:hypothetical protein
MMPVVRISDQTWERMQKYAKPLVDTPDSVINNALDALDKAEGNVAPKNVLTTIIEKKRQQNNELTPQKEFRPLLLKALLLLGGQAPVGKIRDSLQSRVKTILKPGDLELVSSGDIRWWNAVCWERADLVREGLFRSDSPRGVWELTENGKSTAKKL